MCLIKVCRSCFQQVLLPPFSSQFRLVVFPGIRSKLNRSTIFYGAKISIVSLTLSHSLTCMILQLSWVTLSRNLLLAYQSFGVVYGDLSTSPLYVYTNTFAGKMQKHQTEEVIFGAFSLIFWTFTLIPLIKYICILLSADDNGEGETELLFQIFFSHEF